MIEFLTNIGLAIWENREAILVFLSSSQFIAFLTAMVTLRRYNKSTKSSNEQAKALKGALDGQNTLTTVAQDTYGKTAQLETDLAGVKNLVEKNDEKTQTGITLITEKMNLMLEVLSIVYSGIKDERIRTTVNGLLLNAKYAEASTRSELQKQIEELREQVAKKSDELTKIVNDTAGKTLAALTGESEQQEEVVERY